LSVCLLSWLLYDLLCCAVPCCVSLQVQQDDLQEALRSFTRALTAAVAFLDSRQAGMLAQLDRQAKELFKRVQVRRTHRPAQGMLLLVLDHPAA
jgi:hypothetical protein